jgi:hypothetical protein
MSALGQKRTRALQQKERPVRDASKLIRTYDRNTYAAEKKAALDSYWPSVQQRPPRATRHYGCHMTTRSQINVMSAFAPESGHLRCN